MAKRTKHETELRKAKEQALRFAKAIDQFVTKGARSRRDYDDALRQQYEAIEEAKALIADSRKPRIQENHAST